MSDLSSMLDKTLQELDGRDWGEPHYSSHLVTECHRRRSVPLKDFSVEDLRLMIGQQCSLEYLVPLALNHLEADPMISGDYYEGDLLGAIQKIAPDFWQGHAELNLRWKRIVEISSRPFPYPTAATE